MTAPALHPIGAMGLVALGGAAGSGLRYLVTLAAGACWPKFPAGTLVVNVFGCLMAGVLLHLAGDRNLTSPQVRLLVISGFLGGLTTFSAFGFETAQLVQRGQAGIAMLNVAANVGLSLGAVFAGYAAARAVA